MIFTENRYDRSIESMMKGIPNFYPRGSGIVVTGRFEYTADMCDCRLCEHYGGKLRDCKVPRCVCLEERIAVGVASLKEVMKETMSEIKHSGFLRRLRKYVKENDPFLLLIIECFTCSVLFAVISGSFEFSRYHSEFSLNGEAVWKILYLGIFATCFAQFAQLFGQKFVSPTTTSIILSFEAVFGTVFELIFREEMNLTVFMIIGFLLIFLALIINEVGLPDFK